LRIAVAARDADDCGRAVWLGGRELASVVIVLWPVLMVSMPGADWRSGAGVAEQTQWISFWVRTVFRALLAALILGLIGRPRLIFPIVVGCIGTGLLWLFTALME
jgi:hypothetical protein